MWSFLNSKVVGFHLNFSKKMSQNEKISPPNRCETPTSRCRLEKKNDESKVRLYQTQELLRTSCLMHFAQQCHLSNKSAIIQPYDWGHNLVSKWDLQHVVLVFPEMNWDRLCVACFPADKFVPWQCPRATWSSWRNKDSTRRQAWLRPLMAHVKP